MQFNSVPSLVAFLSPASLLRDTVICIAGLLAFSSALAQPQDSVRWDDRANKWIYTLYHPDGSGVYKEISYTPRNQVEPKVSSKLRRDKDGFEYRYQISNARGAVHSISNFKVVTPAWDAQAFVRRKPIKGETSAQAFARGDADRAKEDEFLNKTIFAPSINWDPYVNLRSPERVALGWLLRYVEAQPKFKGIDPGQKQGGFAVLRPELPGVAQMFFKGNTSDLMNAGALPGEGAIGEHVAQVMNHDFVTVPVLVPAIIVPQPYNSAELARRIKAHVNTWTLLEVIDQALLDALNIQLDRLIAALQANDKPGARRASATILADLFGQHQGMTQHHFDDDADEHDASPMPNPMKRKQAQSGKAVEPAHRKTAEPAIHRIAARALGANLRYLMTHVGEKD